MNPPIKKSKIPKKSGTFERASAQADDSLAGNAKRRDGTNLDTDAAIDIRKEAKFLTPKQQRFVREYVIDLNGTQAAIRAGYGLGDPGRHAHELLKHPLVLSCVEKLQAGRAAALALKAEDVLASLLEIRERCMQAEEVTEWDFAKKCFVGTGQYRFDSTGANRATELIGKHLGMFSEKFAGTIKIDTTVQHQAATLADLPPELLAQLESALSGGGTAGRIIEAKAE